MSNIPLHKHMEVYKHQTKRNKKTGAMEKFVKLRREEAERIVEVIESLITEGAKLLKETRKFEKFKALVHGVLDELGIPTYEGEECRIKPRMEELQCRLSVDSDPGPYPMQPIVQDSDGTPRFKQNRIVGFLLDAGPFDMNQLRMMPFDDWERSQFAQLIGYSTSGFGELSYAYQDHVRIADSIADMMLAEDDSCRTEETV